MIDECPEVIRRAWRRVFGLAVVCGLVLFGCEERHITTHYDEADHIAVCASACQKTGQLLARYNDTSGECVCTSTSTEGGRD